ncbi:MAG: excinuclease ABC subunit UvrA, partial [Cyanobacteria bacterium]|nr:excinuclease ABC subunit UvrA [Cyanobacteriota bacterium]
MKNHSSSVFVSPPAPEDSSQESQSQEAHLSGPVPHSSGGTIPLMAVKHIKVSGARVNNLKNVFCQFPHKALTVVTGPSGSGKSSLAFDTLYAEGQRRYIESMSAYARQFLERIEKPDVDSILHILPAIALEQKNTVKNARSTVGTSTEIYDYIRLLFANIGETHCELCGGLVSKANPAFILKQLEAYPPDSKVVLYVPLRLAVKDLPELIGSYVKQGYFRILNPSSGEVEELSSLLSQPNPSGLSENVIGTSLNKLSDQVSENGVTQKTGTGEVAVSLVIDRLVLNPTKSSKASQSRITESIQNALLLGNGQLGVYALGGSPGEKNSQLYQSAFACLSCHHPHTEPFPNMFSFNSPMGACEVCEGFGRVIGLDMEKIIPNPGLTLREGAIHPFTMPSNLEIFETLCHEASKKKIPLDTPYQALNDAQKTFVIEGSGSYPGIRSFFDWLESKKYKVHVRVMLAKYRGYYDCPSCLGSRLKKQALNVFLGTENILTLSNQPVDQVLQFFKSLPLTPQQALISERLIREILSRLMYLDQVGLGYLTLARHSRTLSGGEAQRINLSKSLGIALTETLYVLDEPTVGLHARDTDRLLNILKALRNLGNTLVVVEHDPDIIQGADYIIDMGPGGGEEGGRIVYEGDLPGLLATPFSITASYLNNARHLHPQKEKAFDGKDASPPQKSKKSPLKTSLLKNFHQSDPIVIVGARGNNLKNITVSFPKNQLVCVTGVSGSGKSTLIKQTLYAGYQREKGQAHQWEMAPHQSLEGLEEFEDVIMVDQTPPGRSARSNPVTYVKAYDEIRQLFAASRKAVALGITAGHFSFNTPGGRCETCEG